MRRERDRREAVRYGTYPECSTGAACCLTNCLNDLTSSIIKCLIPFVESSCSNPKSNGTSHNGSSAGSCQTDRLLLASSLCQDAGVEQHRYDGGAMPFQWERRQSMMVEQRKEEDGWEGKGGDGETY